MAVAPRSPMGGRYRRPDIVSRGHNARRRDREVTGRAAVRTPSAFAVPGPTSSYLPTRTLPGDRSGRAGSRPLLPKGSLEPGHAYLLPWAGGPSACRRHSAATSRLNGLPFCSAGNQVLGAEGFLTDGEAPLLSCWATRRLHGIARLLTFVGGKSR